MKVSVFSLHFDQLIVKSEPSRVPSLRLRRPIELDPLRGLSPLRSLNLHLVSLHPPVDAGHEDTEDHIEPHIEQKEGARECFHGALVEKPIDWVGDQGDHRLELDDQQHLACLRVTCRPPMTLKTFPTSQGLTHCSNISKNVKMFWQGKSPWK